MIDGWLLVDVDGYVLIYGVFIDCGFSDDFGDGDILLVVCVWLWVDFGY